MRDGDLDVQEAIAKLSGKYRRLVAVRTCSAQKPDDWMMLRMTTASTNDVRIEYVRRCHGSVGFTYCRLPSRWESWSIWAVYK